MQLKKLCIGAVTIISFMLAGSIAAFAAVLPETVRVGLEYKYKEVGSITISNKEITVGIEQNGIYEKGASFTSDSGFIVRTASSSYMAADREFSDYMDCLDRAEEYRDQGYEATPALTGQGVWQVYIAGADAGDLEEDVSAIGNQNKIIEVWMGSSLLCAAGNEAELQIAAADNGEILMLGDRSYRGRMEFGRYSGKMLTAVNVISVDEYLYGVVPSEMPQSFEEEALKAQAIAARSYMMTQLGVHSKSGYELCDGVHCQAYNGVGNEAEKTSRIVDETSGMLAFYDGEPINAVFFSSSGGATDDSENVWPNAVPYLRGVEEMNEVNADQWTRGFSASEIQSLVSASGSNIGSIQDVVITKTSATGRVLEVQIVGSNGTKTLEKEETRTFFNKGGSLKSRNYTIVKKGGSIVQNKKVQAVEGSSSSSQASSGNTSASGAKPSTKTPGNISLTGESIQVSGLGTIAVVQASDSYIIGGNSDIYLMNNGGVVAFDNGVIPSGEIKFPEKKAETAATPERETKSSATSATKTETSASTATEDFTIVGSGNGHGVGMSQWGAHGMALQGYNYKEILQHYYTDITVE